MKPSYGERIGAIWYNNRRRSDEAGKLEEN